MVQSRFAGAIARAAAHAAGQRSHRRVGGGRLPARVSHCGSLAALGLWHGRVVADGLAIRDPSATAAGKRSAAAASRLAERLRPEARVRPLTPPGMHQASAGVCAIFERNARETQSLPRPTVATRPDGRPATGWSCAHTTQPLSLSGRAAAPIGSTGRPDAAGLSTPSRHPAACRSAAASHAGGSDAARHPRSGVCVRGEPHGPVHGEHQSTVSRCFPCRRRDEDDEL